MNLENELKNLGFSDKEARVYIASLELGQASAAEIATRSGVNRATTYVILEELQKRGFVSTFEKGGAKGRSGKKAFFVAESPERLKTYFEEREAELQAGMKNLGALMPELTSLFEARGERPKVRFFDGLEGVAAIREDMITTSTDFFYELANLDETHRFFSPKYEEQKVRLAEKNNAIDTRVIYTSEKGPTALESSDSHKHRFAPLEILSLPAEMDLYGEKVAFFSFRQGAVFGVIIEDTNISATLRHLFLFFWNQLGQRS